jgi:hypothetical protein
MGAVTALNILLLGKSGQVGWKPARTFETVIRKTVQWCLDHPDWVAHLQSGAYRKRVQKQYAGTCSFNCATPSHIDPMPHTS